jgi:hypothetical protein
MSDFQIDNPYNPDSNDDSFANLPLDEIIRRAIRSELSRARVMMPCKIIKINGPQNVDVQPLFKTRYIDGKLADLPAIQQVPVSMPMGFDYFTKYPLKVGDIGYALFCDRSIDNWVASSGEVVDPNDNRAHSISDAIFVPALVPSSLQSNDKSDDYAFGNGKAVFRIQKAGKFTLSNGSNELLDLLVNITTQLKILSDTLAKDNVNTIFGLSVLNSKATYANIETEVEQLLAKLTTLKGS